MPSNLSDGLTEEEFQKITQTNLEDEIPATVSLGVN